MAASNELITSGLPRRRLGRWWRLWIACSAWWTLSCLALATTVGGWSNGVAQVLLICASAPVLFLSLGLTVSWTREGKRP